MAYLKSGTAINYQPGNYLGQGSSSFQKLLGGNVKLGGQGSRDFNRLLKKDFRPKDYTRLGGRAQKQLAKAVLRVGLRQGLGINPSLKLALEIIEQLREGGTAYQISEKTIWNGSETYSYGPADTEPWTDPFPAPNYQSILFGTNPNVYSRIYLPWHNTLHQYRYQRVTINGFGQHRFWYSKGIPAGNYLKAGPGYNFGMGGFREKKIKTLASGKYRWLRDQGVKVDPDKTRTGFKIGKKGPPTRTTTKGRPRGPESKVQLSVRGYRYIIGMANALGEAYEWIDMLAAASGWEYNPEVGGSRLYNKFVYLFFQGGIENVDWNKLHDETLENMVEDFIFGKLGKLSKYGARGIGRIVGLQAGLSM